MRNRSRIDLDGLRHSCSGRGSFCCLHDAPMSPLHSLARCREAAAIGVGGELEGEDQHGEQEEHGNQRLWGEQGLRGAHWPACAVAGKHGHRGSR
jgi:hypothetical protein